MQPIPGFPGYFATPEGQIISTLHKPQRVLLPQMHNGYPHVKVRVCGRRRKIVVHRLVLLALVGPKPTPEHECRHLDGDTSNSSITNICWGTKAENAMDQVRHGTAVGLRVGDAHPRTVLSFAECKSIRERVAAGENAKDIAKEFPLNPDYLKQIADGKARIAA